MWFKRLYRSCSDQWAVPGRANAYRCNSEQDAARNHRSLWRDRFAHPGRAHWPGTASCHGRFRSSAYGGRDAHAPGDPIRPDQPVSLAPQGKSSRSFTRKISGASHRVFAGAAAPRDESNLDGSGHWCYGFAAVASCGGANFMSGAKPARKRQSVWETLRTASGSYRRLYGYLKPYKTRFILGLALGLAYGGVNSLFPLAIARVTSTIFHGAAPNPMAVRSNLHVLDTGPKINSIVLICLAIPAIMAVRSLCSYGSTYCMQWVSNRVVSDIRVQLFSKMVRHSMDFFNKMRSGFLMSRITNDTRVMQMALTSVSSDVFKQPITIVGAITVLLLMDWKFTVVTLILFPTCLLPLRVYDPIKTLSRIHIVMQRSVAATTAIFSILDSQSTVQDAPNAVALSSSEGRIDFENVTFRYANRATDAISNLTLQIEPGKTHALVGASGAGKSTILSLILRLYDPTSGAVKIDGQDLRSITQKSLREQMGLVTQETFLFHDTIFNNIQFGRLDATPEDIYEAAKARSEEHTSELQSHSDLVCRLLLEKKKQ